MRVLRQLRQVRNRIATIEIEIARTSETEIAKLKGRAVEAETEGRDLLSEIAMSVQGRVNVAKQMYENTSAEQNRK